MKKLLLTTILFTSITAFAGSVPIFKITDSDSFLVGHTGWEIQLQNVDVPSVVNASCSKERELGLDAIKTLRNILVKADSLNINNYTFNTNFVKTGVDMQVDGKDIAQTLIDRGLARRYTWNYVGWC